MIIPILHRLSAAFFVCFIISAPAYTQTNKINFGEVQKKEGGLFALFRLIDLDSNNYYLHSSPKGNDLILRYSLRHALLSTTDVTQELGRKDLSFRNLYRTPNGQFAYFLSDLKSSDDDPWKIFVAPFEKGKLGAPKEIFNKEYSQHPEMSSLRNQANLHSTYGHSDSKSLYTVKEFVQSPDQMKVAFLTGFDYGGKENSFSIAVAVFDENHHLLWEQFHTFENLDKRSYVSRFRMTNDGDVLLILKADKKSSEKSENPSTLFVRMNQDNLTETAIKMESEYEIDDVQIFIPASSSKTFSLAGFYSKKDESKRLEGIFVSNDPVTTSVIIPVLYAFPDSVRSMLTTKREQSKKSGIEGTFQLDHEIQFSDGSFAFIAERRFMTLSTSVTANGGTRTSMIYTAGEIIVPYFTTDKKLSAIRVLDKWYETEDWGSESYSYAFFNDKLHLLYNNYLDKSDRKELKEAGIKGSRFTDITILDRNAAIMEQKTIMTDKDYELLFVPFICDYERNKWLIGTMSLNKYSFGIITLK